MSVADQDPLQEAIKRAREMAAKMPKISAKRPASELDDVGTIKVTLAYDKNAAPKRPSPKENNNDEPHEHRSPMGGYQNSQSHRQQSHSHYSQQQQQQQPHHHHHHQQQQQQPQSQSHYNQDFNNSGPLTGANAYPKGGEEKIEIIIPHSVIGLVIGKGGENIKRIQSETGATVRVDPNTVDEQGNKVCTITGTKQAVSDAHSQVTNVIENAATNKRPRLAPEGGDSYRMKIPATRTGAIIGKGGETIKQIKQQSGCDIELDKSGKDANQDESVFVIRGTPDKISKAKSLIEARLASRGRDNDSSGRSGGAGGGGGGAGGPGSGHKYPATGANATPVAPYTDLPTSYGAPAQPGQTPEATAAWNAYYAQYATMFNPANAANQQASPAAAGANPAATGALPYAGHLGMLGANGAATGSMLPQGDPSQKNPSSTGVENASATGPAAIAAPQGGGSQDYTDQWIEYYIAVGRPDYAEQCMQMKKQQQLQQQQQQQQH